MVPRNRGPGRRCEAPYLALTHLLRRPQQYLTLRAPSLLLLPRLMAIRSSGAPPGARVVPLFAVPKRGNGTVNWRKNAPVPLSGVVHETEAFGVLVIDKP